MPILDKARVAVGLHGKTKLDLSHPHITTTNFMDLQPICYRHMIPSEKVVCSASAFARLAPMAVPTYGRCRLNMRAFFVPFRTVMPNFTDFIVDTVSQQFNKLDTASTGIVTSTPLISNNGLVAFFTNQRNSSVSTAASYDFSLYNSGTSTTTYYKFTAAGRRAYKILRSLGYGVVWEQAVTSVNYSALALLAYLRVYVDWYSLSAYMDTQSYQVFLSWFKYHDPTQPLILDYQALITVFDYLERVCYDGDYFTSAWDNPVSPNNGLFSNFLIPDITVTGNNNGNYRSWVWNDSNSNSYSTPIVSGNTSGTSPAHSHPVYQFSQYADDALKALTDYMKRHQLTGARTIDRYLADFGINLPADKLQRSTYLGMSSMDIQVGDVMSNADTAGANDPSNLGDYAGQGFIKGGKTFEYQASEFGLFVICASILPMGSIVQGYDRNNLHTTKDQFFNPDFDCLGVQAITKGEVYLSKNGQFGGQADYDGVFGYTPRYAEYKVGRAQLTGDISLDSVLAGGSSWHLFRMFNDAFFTNITNLKHDIGFCLGRDADQYSRIFNSTDSSYDKFYVIYDFQMTAQSPCKSLFDTYEFEDESRKVTLDANGVKMN